ncbi:hypothetical protein ACS0TY_006549 [Phlomoides rotata]
MGVSWLPFKKFHGKSFTKCCFKTVLLLFLCFSGICYVDSASASASVPLGFEVNAFDSSSNWLSENGVFSFGFLEIDGDEYVVGIKYNLGNKSVNLPVWTVGGGLRVPVTSTFRVAMDGRLILMNNLSRVTLWSSNTSSLGVQKASLLDNGNLVLLGSKDEVVWQSFDYPTNTLLPNQSIRYPKNLRALSTSPILSYYNLVINHLGELALVWEHNVTYWSSHISCNEARFDSSGVLGLYDDRNKVVWSISPKDYGDPSVTLRHLRIDRDGNLRIYSWDSGSRAWKAVWQAVEDQCDVFGSCGLYSICGYNLSGPVCDCLFSGSPELGFSGSGIDSVASSGCKRMTDLGNCRMHTSMLVLSQTVLYGLYPSHDVEMSLSETDCKGYCSNDTTCIAATSMNDGSGRCTLKRTTFVSGYKTPYVHAVSFLKVCSVPQAVAARGNGSISSSDRLKGSPKRLIGAIALIVLLTLLVILSFQMLLFWLLYHRRKGKVRTFGKDSQMNPHYSILIRLSYEEINELTSNFTNQIGTSVFRGVLPNKTPIVAKVLKDVVVSEKEFRVKVSTLSGTHHRNLVSVKGFCYEPGNKCLIYEYVPNGSLDKWLFNPKAPGDRPWQLKLDIALGVARGLAYLHSECLKCINHGNLKLENVLLDENMVPKLTDFGLDDFFMKHSASSSSSSPSSTSESPSERDVYMLGEMLLQVVTCKRDVLGDSICNILDKEEKLAGDEGLEAIERIARIAFWCMQDQHFLRPSIGEVVKVLEGMLSVDRPPSRLARKDDREVVTEIEVAAEC